MADIRYEEFVRSRITQLRMERNLSEHRMSLDLDKSGSYIRSITSGATMPSVKELFNIILYFEMSPAEFFAGTVGKNTLRMAIGEQLRELDDEDLKKVSLFINWVKK